MSIVSALRLAIATPAVPRCTKTLALLRGTAISAFVGCIIVRTGLRYDTQFCVLAPALCVCLARFARGRLDFELCGRRSYADGPSHLGTCVWLMWAL